MGFTSAHLDGCLALGRLLATDEDAIGLLQVVDGRALREELGVGEDLEGDAGIRAVAPQHLPDRLRRLHGHLRAARHAAVRSRGRRRAEGACGAPPRAGSHHGGGGRTVDFSTTILDDLDTEAIMRAAPSQ